MKLQDLTNLADRVKRTLRPVDLEARFAGKVALITGGASGIGRELGAQLVALGAEAVVLTDVDQEQLERTAWALGGEAAGVYAMPLDVTKARDFQVVVATFDGLCMWQAG